jgi:antigen flippase
MPTAEIEAPSQLVNNPGQPASAASRNTYGQILKSSAIVGGSQVLNIVIGMVRTKVMAVLLGPSGFGLFGLYNSISNLMLTFAGMGVNSSGVRQIAIATNTEDSRTIAITVFVLRRVSVLLGLLNVAVMLLFANQISLLTFATGKHAAAIRWLSIAVFLSLISASQTALIQGMRRIADLARIQVLGAFFGTICAIPLVYFFREKGVVPSLICVAIMTITTSWWYSRKISLRAHKSFSISDRRIREEASALLKLGIAMMSGSLVTLAVAFVVRIIILHRLSMEATGLYQSAWTLGSLYVGFILQAMGADFYPRLTAHAHDNPICNRLVNEQAQVGMLLAGPGVIASLTLAPLIIALFYSTKFGPAVGILRWICLGTMLQVISWPMGFVIIAKAKRATLVACEAAWGIVSIILAWVCIAPFGLTGAGIAYFGSYIFHTLMLYAIVSRLSGFRCSKENRITGLVSLSLVAIAFFGFFCMPILYSAALGSLAAILHSVYSVHRITSYLEPEQIPSSLRQLLRATGLIHRHKTNLTYTPS